MRPSTPALLASCLLIGCGDGGAGTGASDSDIASSTSAATSTTSTTATSEATASTIEPTSAGPGTATADTTDTADTSDTANTSGTSETTGGPDPATPCAPLPPPAGRVINVTPAQAGELPSIVADAASDTTIALADGTYDMSAGALLHFVTPGVTLRSQSGDRDAVMLDGKYGLGELALISASDITIADITLTRSFWHPIHVTGGAAANVENTTIYNVRVLDPGQQGIKVNASPEGFYADHGLIACSSIELTDSGRAQVKDNCYTGGIDAHSAWGWTIRDNYVEGFWCEQGLSEHAIHLWVTCRDTLVERNIIVDCGRGVGFGLGETGNGKTRVYPDDPCPGLSYVGHIDGIIRTTTVLARRPELFASAAGFDSGIALEQACGAQVYHNTVASLQPPFTAIEYRWPNTSAILTNNLATHAIKQRDGATAQLNNNLSDAPLSHFFDAPGGDLHLAADSPAIDAGAPLAPGLADDDQDGDPRDASPDIGADERAP